MGYSRFHSDYFARPALGAADAAYPEFWDGLVGAWSPCHNPPGGTLLHDMSGYGAHGTLTNMDPATDWIPGQGFGALDFDGSNDYVTMGYLPQLNLTANFSASAWVKVDAVGSGFAGFLSNRHSGGAQGWLLGFSTGYDTFNRIVAFTGGYTASNTVITLGVWYHAVIVFDASGGSLMYLNGKLDTHTAGTNAPEASTSTATMLGTFYVDATTLILNGDIAEVLVHNRQLTPIEISLLFSLGPGGWAARRRRSVVAPEQATATQYSWWAWQKYGELVSV